MRDSAAKMSCTNSGSLSLAKRGTHYYNGNTPYSPGTGCVQNGFTEGTGAQFKNETELALLLQTSGWSFESCVIISLLSMASTCY